MLQGNTLSAVYVAKKNCSFGADMNFHHVKDFSDFWFLFFRVWSVHNQTVSKGKLPFRV